MSEYQYYEFVAVDRPLTREQQAELRAISTRAEISATRFTNEYHWGNFKGDPFDMMVRYFDAHVYATNWGTRELLFGYPVDAIDPSDLEPYIVAGRVEVQVVGTRVVVTFHDEDEPEYDEDEDHWMAALLPLRAEIERGDFRSLYLAWLRAALAEELDDDDLEPPVPSGLGALTGAQESLRDFLRVGADAVALAAARSASLPSDRGGSLAELRAWVAALDAAEQVDLLVGLLGDSPGLAAATLRRFRAQAAPARQQRTDETRRTVGELIAAVEAARAEARRAREEQARLERERRAAEAARAREARLASLVGREEDLWRTVEQHVGTKKPGEYDRAVATIADLRALAERGDSDQQFQARLVNLRHAHAKKTSFIERLDRAGLR